MKRAGGLFERIASRDNLVAALWRASCGKRNRQEVQWFLQRAELEINRIVNDLACGCYRFESYRRFHVRDTKTREIHAPAFRDRVVHHAIVAVAGPVLESGALYHSYACRQGKGQHAALEQARQWTRRSHWYGKIDVRRFYDSLHHETLRRLLARRFSERRLLRLFDDLLESYETAPGCGLPIGALTSQYLANFYLDEFDRRMKATRLAPRYLRYMDDIVIWSTADRLDELREIARRELAELHLTMKDGGQWNQCVQGLPLLGFVLYPDRLRVNRNGRRRLRRKLRAVRRDFASGRIEELELQQRLSSLFAHVTHADDRAWRQAVLACLEGEAGEWD